VSKIIAALANVLLVLIVCVSYAPAQEPSAPKPKVESPPPMTKTDLPKNEVEQTLDEAKKNGDKVLTVCLEDCDNSNDLITSGIEVGHVVELPQPEYPALAARAHVSGQVQVQVVIGLEGDVIAAHAIAGHPLLQASAVSAARKARFTPTLLEGKPVKVAGVIAYNFIR